MVFQGGLDETGMCLTPMGLHLEVEPVTHQSRLNEVTQVGPPTGLVSREDETPKGSLLLTLRHGNA